MTTPTTPARSRSATASPREFVESAKDAGDPYMIALARRVWWAISFARPRPCSPQDMQVFRDWCAD